MTFDEWWETKPLKLKMTTKSAAKAAWDRATSVERKRCLEIVEDLGRYADIAEMLEKIGE